MIKLEDIQRARETLHGVAHYTAMDYSETFSHLAQNDVYLKLENLQKTGSFKVRGAYNKIVSLNESERRKGVIAASAGNHAQGVAFAGSKANLKSTIVMPEGAAIAKIEATKSYGAKIVLHGETFDEAMDYALRLQEETGATFVHAFNDEKVIIGQGTVGLEILEQVPDVDIIVCPIGGGGLISGIAKAVKELKPSVKIYGVEAEACPSMIESLRRNKPLKVVSESTIADGIAVKQPGDITFDMVQKYVDDTITVDDLEISRAMLYLLERGKQLIEGSGAASLAALLTQKIPHKGKKAVAILSGGNVDVHFVSRIIEHGLVEAGRFVKISTLVPDKPGHLNQLLNIVAKQKANVISVEHYRISSRVIPGQTEIVLSLETKDRQHIEAIEKELKKTGYPFSRKT